MLTLADPALADPACFGQVLGQAARNERDRRSWQPTRYPEQIESEEFPQRKVDDLFPRSRFGLVCFSLTLPQMRFRFPG